MKPLIPIKSNDMLSEECKVNKIVESEDKLRIKELEKELAYYKRTKSYLRERLKYICETFRNGHDILANKRFNKALQYAIKEEKEGWIPNIDLVFEKALKIAAFDRDE